MIQELIFRKAEEKDILSIISLVWNDNLRKSDQNEPVWDIKSYRAEFNKITEDKNQFILVAEQASCGIVGTCHLTLISYLPFFNKRVQVEYVRVSKESRSMGVGQKMFDWIKSKSESWNADLIQLTTDCRRPDAIKFYKKIGFQPSHVGMKLRLKK